MARRESDPTSPAGPNLPAGVPHLPATSHGVGVLEAAPRPPPPTAEGVSSLAQELGLGEFGATQKQEPRLAYRVGVLPTCPLEVVTVGGVAFPRYTERVSGSGADTVRAPQAGAVAFLTATQRSDVIAAIKKRFVRRSGARSEVLMEGAPTFGPAKRQQGDEPLAMHVYMQRAPELDGTAGVSPQLPKSLAEDALSGG